MDFMACTGGGGHSQCPPQSPSALVSSSHSVLHSSPRRDRHEKYGIASPRSCLSPRRSAAVLSSQDRLSRPFPAYLSSRHPPVSPFLSVPIKGWPQDAAFWVQPVQPGESCPLTRLFKTLASISVALETSM